ncbi:GLPGLI family protein [Pedobacter sp. G11]|uniref:GLPGLI family protein n=1 Tax=Pedobacter sp. G11 TaxID=2482728 RepID=UPI000F5DA51E|nr:GLPGLI family protein [Pedobacter sp. G11]AZI24109.1 GLPGLI family protein [Pedobacter sp. G11]
MRTFIFCLVISLISQRSVAQEKGSVLNGKIEYERRVNKYAFIEKSLNKFNSNSMREDYIKYKTSHPQFLTMKSVLSFAENKSLFTPLTAQDNQVENRWNGQPIAEQINVVFSDFTEKKTVTEKKVLGDIFLVNDSLKKITWKITDETRDIAGFLCRRANGLVLDSVYAVAFYTTSIPLSGGPESFSGLPGMILGIALPHENVSWFATRVEVGKPMVPVSKPVKGRQITYRELVPLLRTTLKNFEGGGGEIIKALLL